MHRENVKKAVKDYGLLLIVIGLISFVSFQAGTSSVDNQVQPEQQLENEIWENSIARVPPNSSAKVGVACSQAEHSNYNDSIKYHCLGMVDRSAAEFNIVFQAKCEEANTTRCGFKYWERGSHLRTIEN